MTKQLTVQDQIKGTIKAMEPEFKAGLPPHIPVEKFMRVAQTAILTNPAVMNLEKMSLYSSCLKAAQDGLLPDGKEAALVPYGQKATYMPMVAGILKKIRNSGEVISMTAQLVYEKDEFNYFVDEDGEHLVHKPDVLATDRGEVRGVYAQAKLKDGTVCVEVLNMKDIEAIKGASRSKSGPWSGPFKTEMMKKSAIRRLSKRLPMSTDIEKTIHSDDQYYDFKEPRVVENESVDTPNLEESMNIQEAGNTPDIEIVPEVLDPDPENDII